MELFLSLFFIKVLILGSCREKLVTPRRGSPLSHKPLKIGLLIEYQRFLCIKFVTKFNTLILLYFLSIVKKILRDNTLLFVCGDG